MKNIFKAGFTAILIAGASVSCNFIDPKINVDPNQPADVPINLLTAGIETNIAYVLGGDFGRYTNIWTQHLGGVDRQHLGYDLYQLTESNVNTAWDLLYRGSLVNLKSVLTKANESKSPHYSGMAKILTAYTLGMLVDQFNDIPYTDAVQGSTQLKPKYDKADAIYTEIQKLLTEAKTDLGQTTSTFSPGSDDIIFKGNRPKWIALANALSARYYLHLGKIDAGSYAKALTALTGAISANTGNAMMSFDASATGANPWAQFIAGRNDFRMGKKFIDIMSGLNDPRIEVMADTIKGGIYKGSTAGNGDVNSSEMSAAFYAADDSKVPFFTYSEVKFIEAEAAFATNDKTRAATALNDAVKASLAYYGVSSAAYVTANASTTAATVTLERIMTQKYIHMFTQPEAYSDWRRTGLPALTPATGTRIPRRFPYPQDERLYNGANYIPNVTIFDKVFWDK
jgi:Starch-binding associating with outer membrane